MEPEVQRSTNVLGDPAGRPLPFSLDRAARTWETFRTRPMARKKVLIVEDVPSTRDAIALLVANRGCDPIVAHDGRDALETARSLRPDLIILDSEIPGVSGYEVYAALKQDPDLKGIPVLFLVADTETTTIPTRSVPPAQFLVRKPFKAHDLADRIARALGPSGGE
jgi:CheY-like chemotaxis protein